MKNLVLKPVGIGLVMLVVGTILAVWMMDMVWGEAVLYALPTALIVTAVSIIGAFVKRQDARHAAARKENPELEDEIQTRIMDY